MRTIKELEAYLVDAIYVRMEELKKSHTSLDIGSIRLGATELAKIKEGSRPTMPEVVLACFKGVLELIIALAEGKGKKDG